MAVISTTITPLMLAAANGLMQNQGFELNQALNSQILTYIAATPVSPSSLGIVANGTLTTDGVYLYDQWIEVDPLDPNIVTPQTTNLGTMAARAPGCWLMDSTLYIGSLSAFGGMVAARISSGYEPQGQWEPDPVIPNASIWVANDPIYSGRYDTYYGDPTKQALGASTIPGITQTIPDTVTEISGSLKYHMDKAINLPIGSNTTSNVSVVISTLGQASGYVQQANMFLNAVKTAEDTDLPYYGYKSYQDFIGQGWLKYKTGTALINAFKNIGTMTDSIYTGKFGTPGAVAHVLLGRNLGDVGGLEKTLIEQGVNLSDIMNPMYTEQITRVLSGITDPSDLATIQETIESTLPSMQSALDYTSISKCAGGAVNDSEFASFADIGVDLYNKSPYISIERGSDIAYIIENISVPYYTDVESVKGTGSLLSSTITDSIRQRLPKNSTNTPLTVFDVIGSPSGYYEPNLAVVNTSIDDLDNTPYGPQIRTNLQALVATAGNVAPVGSVTTYNQLMNTIITDSNVTISNIVSRINTNYKAVSQHVGTETYNWNLLGLISRGYASSTSTSMMSFATALPGYLTDPQGIKMYEYLSGLISDNQTGNIIRSIFAESKNYTLIQNFSLTPNGYIG